MGPHRVGLYLMDRTAYRGTLLLYTAASWAPAGALGVIRPWKLDFPVEFDWQLSDLSNTYLLDDFADNSDRYGYICSARVCSVRH